MIVTLGRIMSGILVAVCIGLSACVSDEAVQPTDSGEPSQGFGGIAAGEAPAALQDGWPVATLGEAGFDDVAIAELTRAIEGGKFPNTHALLIEHSGRLVYERYFEGKDQRWGRPLGHVVFDRDSLHDLRSVSKSVTSALLGIALGGDYAKALDTPIVDYFEDLEGKFGDGVEHVTLRHVLTMTAGLEWNEMSVPYTNPTNDEIRLSYTSDPVAMVLARPARDPAGAKWYYNGGLTQVLAGLIQRRTGKLLNEFAEEVLFAPLGITEYEWLGTSTWRPKGMPSAASGLRMRARDLAKIGSVFLHGGSWQGRQIVPAEWVELSTRRHVENIPWGQGGVYGYGFMWYPGRSHGEPSYTIIRAAGNGDQRVFIIPEDRIVVTVFAGNYNRHKIRNGKRILARVMAARRGDE